jgi:hypothetical protein
MTVDCCEVLMSKASEYLGVKSLTNPMEVFFNEFAFWSCAFFAIATAALHVGMGFNSVSEAIAIGVCFLLFGALVKAKFRFADFIRTEGRARVSVFGVATLAAMTTFVWLMVLLSPPESVVRMILPVICGIPFLNEVAFWYFCVTEKPKSSPSVQ